MFYFTWYSTNVNIKEKEYTIFAPLIPILKNKETLFDMEDIVSQIFQGTLVPKDVVGFQLSRIASVLIRYP